MRQEAGLSDVTSGCIGQAYAAAFGAGVGVGLVFGGTAVTAAGDAGELGG